MENKPRILSLLIIFVCFFLIVVVRLIDVQLLHHKFYENISQEQRKRIIKLAAQRGDIFDRNGNILATSVDSYSVYLHRRGWLARKLPQEAAERLKQRDPEQISLLKEKKRVYPKKKLGAQVMGFVGVDNQGLSGLEHAYDEFLRGKEGRLITESDPRGRELYGAIRELEPGIDGMNVTLTIDENIQYVAERELSKQIKKMRGRSGICLVMDAETGELYALAGKPDFDPNEYQKYRREYWHPSCLNPYEPGSTFKIFTVAAALEEGVISVKTKLKALDKIEVGGKIVENAHSIDWDGRYVSVSRVLEQSINTGSVQISQKLGPKKFYEYIRAFGFGEQTNFGLKGESRGIVRFWRDWYKPDIGMISFGQGVAVTPLQLIAATAVFANRGRLVQPFLVKRIESNDGKIVRIFSPAKGKRVVSERVARQMKELMWNVVREGTGHHAQIKGFKISGKTGTAQKARPGGRGYLKNRYVSSFVGFAPFNNPRLVALVIIDEPGDVVWGGQVCAPVFKNVMEYSLRYLNAKPDML